jgi:hypothetical protein
MPSPPCPPSVRAAGHAGPGSGLVTTFAPGFVRYGVAAVGNYRLTDPRSVSGAWPPGFAPTPRTAGPGIVARPFVPGFVAHGFAAAPQAPPFLPLRYRYRSGSALWHLWAQGRTPRLTILPPGPRAVPNTRPVVVDHDTEDTVPGPRGGRPVPATYAGRAGSWLARLGVDRGELPATVQHRYGRRNHLPDYWVSPELREGVMAALGTTPEACATFYRPGRPPAAVLGSRALFEHRLLEWAEDGAGHVDHVALGHVLGWPLQGRGGNDGIRCRTLQDALGRARKARARARGG